MSSGVLDTGRPQTPPLPRARPHTQFGIVNSRWGPLKGTPHFLAGLCKEAQSGQNFPAFQEKLQTTLFVGHQIFKRGSTYPLERNPSRRPPALTSACRRSKLHTGGSSWVREAQAPICQLPPGCSPPPPRARPKCSYYLPV